MVDGHPQPRVQHDLTGIMAIVEGLADCVVITDMELRTVQANEAALKRFGRTRQEVLGIPCYNFVAEEDVPKAFEAMDTAIREGSARNIEATGIAKNGERFPISVNATLLRDEEGRPSGLLLAVRDMTAIRQAEKEKYAAIWERAAIVDAMNDGLIVTDLDGNIVMCNRAMEEEFKEYGVDIRQLIGRPAAEWPGIRTEDTGKYVELMKQTIEQGKAGPLEMQDNAGRWFCFTTSLLKDANGNPKGMFAVVKDISKLKLAQNERITAMQEMATIAETMSEGLIVTDMDGKVVSFNRAMREHLAEYAADPEEFIGKPATDLPSVKPEDVATYLALMEETIEKGKGGPIEFVNKAGRWSSVTTGLLRDAAGNPRAVFALTRDVSKLREAEAERAKALARQEMAAVVDAMGDGLVMFDMDGKIRHANAALEKLLGWQSGAMVGQDAFDLCRQWIRPDDLGKAVDDLAKVMKGELINTTPITLVKEDGAEVSVVLTTSFMTDAAGTGIGITTIKDITEITRAQERAKAALEERAAIFDAIGDGIVLCDMEGTITDVNPALEKLTGFSKDEMTGRDIGELAAQWLRPEDVEKALKSLTCILSGQTHRGIPLTLVRKDGAEIQITFTSSFRTDAAGKPFALVVAVKDMTEVRRAQEKEKELAAAVERTRMAATVIDAIGDGVLLAGADGKVIAVNPAFEQLTACRKEQVIGRAVAEMIPNWVRGKDLDVSMTMLMAAVTGQAVGPARLTHIAGDGREVPILLAVSLIRDPEGKATHMIATIKDITELERLQEKEKEAAVWQSVGNVIDAMPDGVVVIDMDGRIVSANPAHERITGETASEIIGRNASELLAGRVRPDDIEKAMNGLADALRGDLSGPVVVTLLRQDGREVPMAFTASLMKDAQGRPTHLVEVSKDMTELVRAQEREKELATIVERTRMAATIVDAVSDSVLLAGIDGTVIAINPAFETNSGYARDEVVGKDLAEIMTAFLKPTDLERGVSMLAAALAGKGFGPTRFTYVRKDGSEGPVLVSLSFIRDAEGRPTHLIATIRDITELDRLQKAEKEAEALRAVGDVINAMADGVVLIDMEGKIVSVNPAYERVTGKAASEVVGRDVSELIPIVLKPEDVEKSMNALGVALREGLSRPVIATFLREDGSEAPMAFTASLVNDPKGRPQHLVVVAKDITELRRAQENEKELAAEVARAQMAGMVMDAMGDAVLLATIDGTVIAVNPAMEQTTGYTKDDLVGKNIGELLPILFTGKDMERAMATLGAAIAGQDFGPTRFAYVRKDGRHGAALVTMSFTKDAEGKPTHMVAAIKDIAELERLEQKEKEAAALQYVANALDCMPDPVWLLDLDGTVTYANPASVMSSNASAGDPVGQNAMTLALKGVAPEDMENLMPRLLDMRKGEISPAPLFLNIITDDGRRVPTLMTSGFIRDAQGRPKGIITIAKDVTELKQAEENVRRSEERYRQLLESVTDYICSVTVEKGQAIFTSHGPGCQAVTGYTSEEYQADPLLWFRMIHEADREAVKAYCETILSSMEVAPIEHRIIRKDGAVRWISNTPVVRKNGNGQVLSYDVLIADITKRKQAEQKLKEAHELLEQRVVERTRELLDANRQIHQAQAELVQAEKMGMLGQLVAGVAHEINTPTGAIMNVAADAMVHLRELAAAAMKVLDLPADCRQWLANTIPHVLSNETVISEFGDRDARREIERELRQQKIADYQRKADVMAACRLKASDPLVLRSMAEEPVLVFLEHLTSLKASSEISHASVQKIARIVKALRYYSRSGEGEMFDVNINESIDNTLVILQNRIKHVAKVDRCYQECLPALRLGPDISQVWTNIISNACDAIEGDTDKKTGQIRIATMAKGGDLVVEIFNEGPPIPQKLMARIFDPFFTTKPIGKGTGLGLSICTGILGKYGGTIAASNDPGGVTFRVSLPLASGDAVKTTRLATSTARVAAAKTVSNGGRR